MPENTMLMPVMFIGHGSPMNALETNTVTDQWQQLGSKLPRPKAILVISAHWYITDTLITSQENNQTIHDFFGFPPALSNYEYKSFGSPDIAHSIIKELSNYKIKPSEWGIDHGVWSILTHMYPNPDMPILQLSIDITKTPQWHYELGKSLSKLRSQGIMIIGSGNIVHNLGMLSWNNQNYGADWAIEFDNLVVNDIQKHSHTNLINYHTLSSSSLLCIPTPEHYLPLLYILGASNTDDQITIFNQEYNYGSLSMTSVLLSNKDI